MRCYGLTTVRQLLGPTGRRAGHSRSLATDYQNIQGIVGARLEKDVRHSMDDPQRPAASMAKEPTWFEPPVPPKLQWQTRLESETSSAGDSSSVTANDGDVSPWIEQEKLTGSEWPIPLNQLPHPTEIVKDLNRTVVAQQDAKRAVAIAIRNRWRREHVDPSASDLVSTKNILLIGSTGVGKSLIAREIAKLSRAPFFKLEASRFSQDGVDSVIHGLVRVAKKQTRERLRNKIKDKVRLGVEERILKELDVLSMYPTKAERVQAFKTTVEEGGISDRLMTFKVPRAELIKSNKDDEAAAKEDDGMGFFTSPVNLAGPEFSGDERRAVHELKSNSMLSWTKSAVFDYLAKEWLETPWEHRTHKFQLPVYKVLECLENIKLDSLMNEKVFQNETRQMVEQRGIVFIDEIDKLCGTVFRGRRRGDDDHIQSVSNELIQRQLIPLLEGCNVETEVGTINTAHILFTTSGTFHRTSPSDLIPELQGQLPIRVHLKPLGEADLEDILSVQNAYNPLYHQVELLKTEGILLDFTSDAIKEIASVTCEINNALENIGARRLITVIERVVEEVSFSSATTDGKVTIRGKDVRENIGDAFLKTDLSRYVL